MTYAERKSSDTPKWLIVKSNEIIKKYGDYGSFALKFNPDLQVVCAMNLRHAMTGDVPTIRQLKATYTIDQLRSWLSNQFEDLNNYSGVKDKLEFENMIRLANVFLTKCEHLKASEILLFFHKLKSGDFGVFYGAIDPIVIGNFLNDFMVWRSDELTKIQRAVETERKEAQLKNAREKAVTREEYERRKALKNKK